MKAIPKIKDKYKNRKKKKKSRAKPKSELQNYHTKPGEIWKLVPGTDDYYVSNQNRFRRGNKLRSVKPDKEGYLVCHIGHDKVKLHRLVAMAFLPNPDNLPVVDHINNDRNDCTPENLRWCTQKDNTKFAKDMRLGVNPDKTYIFALNESTLEGSLYESQQETANALGFNRRRISAVVNNKAHRAYGYKFFKVRNFKDYTKNQKSDEEAEK